MQYALLFVLLLTFVLGLGLLARRLDIPYPILFVLGGLVISFLPGLPPQLKLDPNIIFFIFLPPLLYIQALYTSWRDFRFYLRSILLLAIGLVIATTVAIAYLTHWLIPGFPLAAGFVLGAIISPPDAIAASAIAQRLGLPRRIVTILEGESLVNDATSLVLFKVSLAAIGVTASLMNKVWVPGQFVYIAAGGVVVGLVVGWAISWVRLRLMDDGPQIALTMSLLTPFVSYFLADQFLHVSGVLSVVATGFYLGWQAPELMSSNVRLQTQAVWELLLYLLNGIIFLLIGLQLPGILRGILDYSWSQLFFYGFIVNAVCIVIRILWIFPGAYLPRLFSKRIHEREDKPDWRYVTIVGWCGMRGIVSLAAALALNGYHDFPRGHLVQFLAFSVILTTLVFQGLTLPPLIRYLGVGDDGIPAKEELDARTRITDAALEKIAAARREEKYPASALDQIEQFYHDRALSLHDEMADQLGWSKHQHHAVSLRRLQRATVTAQRRTLVALRREGLIGDDVMHKIEHELDLDEARLKI